MKRRKQGLWPDCDNAPLVDRIARLTLERMKEGLDRRTAFRSALQTLRKPVAEADRQHALHYLERLIQGMLECLVRKMRIWSIKGQRAARLSFTDAFQKAASAKHITLEKARAFYSELYRRAVAIAKKTWGQKAYERTARRPSAAPVLALAA